MDGFIVYVWIISFVAIYVALFWILVITLFKLERKKLTKLPFVSIVIPAWNEGKSILSTLEYLDGMDYPKDKFEVIVVDDGSKDDTFEIAKKFSKGKDYLTVLKNEKNSGKSFSVNRALELAKGEYFAVMDADTIADQDLLKKILSYFVKDDVAAVTTQMKVQYADNVWERMQRIEYIFASYVRRMMALIGTLHYTNGIMSVFRTKILRKVGGFSPKVMTEDLEIAMRLKALGYDVRICEDGYGYTKVPKKLKALWRQRVRWFRGYIQTCLLHYKIMANKKHGLLGLFQMPLEIGMLLLMLFSGVFMFYQFFNWAYDQVMKVIILKWDIFTGWKIPTFQEFILGINYQIWIPVFLALGVGLYLYMRAHKHTNEKWRYAFSSFSYLFLYPILRGIQFWHAAIEEIFSKKRKWR
jgi:poly-beta-1,6-N-acetyl-D-glucosamine synthase